MIARALAVLLLAAVPAMAAPGDVYVMDGGSPEPVDPPLPPWPSWAREYPVPSGEIAQGWAFATDGTFTYGMMSGHPGYPGESTIHRRSEDGHTTPLFTVPEVPLFLSRAADGRFYVVTEQHLYVYGPTGTLERQHDVDVGPSTGWYEFPPGDLAPAECRFIFSDGISWVFMYDVCEGTFLRTVVLGDQLTMKIRALRVLKGGGFLAAIEIAGGHLFFRAYDELGRMIAELPYPAVRHIAAMAFDVDPRFIWVVPSHGDPLAKIELRTGEAVVRVPLSTGYRAQIVVDGEQRATLEALHMADVPALSPYALLLVTALLSFVAVRRL